MNSRGKRFGFSEADIDRLMKFSRGEWLQNRDVTRLGKIGLVYYNPKSSSCMTDLGKEIVAKMKEEMMKKT